MNRKNIDWEAIEREYRAGMLSIREIARQYGVSDVRIGQKGRQSGWHRDLSARVRERIKSEVVRSQDICARLRTDEEIISEAAQRGVALVLSHQAAIQRLAEVERALLAEIHDSPKKVYITQFQGEIISEEVEIDVVSRAAGLANLAQVQAKRISLERQAFGIEETPMRPVSRRSKEERDAVIELHDALDD